MTDEHLRGRRILLGVCAGIAAYKAAELARLLVRQGATVQVVMTRSAHQFIGALSLQAITGRPVRDDLFDPAHEAAMGHIELARWADLVVVAPATADFMARVACGLADDLLTTLCLASPAPLVLAPAMNQAMWQHPATVDNVARLGARGTQFLGPAVGPQACGDVGPGRMLEPEQICSALAAQPTPGRPLGEVMQRLPGRRVLVTAGPTREPIDPVRFIANRSSGKMGFAIAAAAAAHGAQVTLIAGPVALPTPVGVERHDVETAREMHDRVMAEIPACDIFIACAAVADYRPVEESSQKMKKAAKHLALDLARNPDILADVAAGSPRPFCVGFAAETQDLAGYAEQKRRAKALDMIAANDVSASQGFDREDNALLVLWEGGQANLPRQSKSRLAYRLVELIADRFDAQTAAEDSRSASR
ncbi:MAG: bifunctional phosphopantothenoylcysteine decarboxylase/phosphopantothenate--cysteine ligase CoaBC [Chromatiaceae bacterium]